MRDYLIQLKDTHKKISPLHTTLGGSNPAGEKLSFTNYYLEKNEKAFFVISGEFHFSRYDHKRWEDELIKMKMGGINTVATYILWNHHEEVEGVFEWQENKNLRKFIELCAKHHLYVIIRIGPFAHGEARNGGMPDWLFGRPFELRSNDDKYLFYVRRLYKQIAGQVVDLLYKNNGPIIGTQLENELQHAGAPWEITAGTSHEWVSAGRDGDAHMKKLKEIALEVGIETPVYTATGWGGAIAPIDSVLPLWGGYAYWPWIFYGDVEEHPATPSFIFRDYHNNDIPKTYDFTPNYQPESIPFACAEMGGGMTVFYDYRFILPYESVDALSLIKAAGGSNFLGYYMYHGGSNPKGKKTPFLNENATPKISYDYQAPIGEFGQVRESYHRLRRQHLFYKQYEEIFTKTKTILPSGTEDMEPEDIDTLRYAVRVDGQSGFIFINNFQDHVETKDQTDFAIELEFDEERVRVPENQSLSLAKDENCILPFHFDVSGVHLKYATTQLLTELEYKGEIYYFFFIPKGMNPEYVFDCDQLVETTVDYGVVKKEGRKTSVEVENKMSLITLVSKDNKKRHICTLTNEDSLQFWKGDVNGRERVLMTHSNVLIDKEKLRLEYTGEEQISLQVFPAFDSMITVNGTERNGSARGIFTKYVMEATEKVIDLDVQYVGTNKATIDFDEQAFHDVKEILLQINYVGDIGYAFMDGELINDNFCNNATWEIGVKRLEKDLLEKGMYVYVSPLREGVSVKSDSPMAARTETTEKEIAEIFSIQAVPVRELDIVFK